MNEAQQELILLLWLLGVNGAPILMTKYFGQRFSYPVDGQQLFFDGRPILGPSKTYRGLVSAVFISIVIGSFFSIPLLTCLLFGLVTMAGDLTSSFIKRRLGLQASSMALGLDQIPESLLPLWVCQQQLGISTAQIFWIVGAFLLVELLLSRVLFWLKIRKEPY